MSDQEDDKKILNDDASQPEDENQSKIDSENQSQSDQNQNLETTSDRNETKTENLTENQNLSADEKKIDESESSSHQVIHKKDGRLHIYVRQDKYKGELKSKNWVGRLYIDGKQKISSSGTTNLEEAIPILEKWFDDVQLESERLKKIAESGEQTSTTTQDESEANLKVEEKIISNETSTTKTETPEPIVPKEENIASDNVTINNQTETKVENTTEEKPANKVSNIFGKLKSLKFKKPSLKGIKLPKSPVKKKTTH